MTNGIKGKKEVEPRKVTMGDIKALISQESNNDKVIKNCLNGP